MASTLGAFQILQSQVEGQDHQVQQINNNIEWLEEHSTAMTQFPVNLQDLHDTIWAQAATITALWDYVNLLEVSSVLVQENVHQLEVAMDINPSVPVSLTLTLTLTWSLL
jgi:hypothetical protein